jgi:hypothetical protein
MESGKGAQKQNMSITLVFRRKRKHFSQISSLLTSLKKTKTKTKKPSILAYFLCHTHSSYMA